MKTRNLGILINQGDDISLVLQLSGDAGPLDLSGYSFVGEMKSNTGQGDADVVAEFSFNIMNQTTNKGKVQMMLASSETEDIITSVCDGEQKQRPPTPYVFDVKMRDNASKITRIIQGIIYVSPQVTQVAP